MQTTICAHVNSNAGHFVEVESSQHHPILPSAPRKVKFIWFIFYQGNKIVLYLSCICFGEHYSIPYKGTILNLSYMYNHVFLFLFCFGESCTIFNEKFLQKYNPNHVLKYCKRVSWLQNRLSAQIKPGQQWANWLLN